MIEISPDSDFSIHNIPFGIYSIDGGQKHVAIAYGDYILDCYLLSKLGLFDSIDIDGEVFAKPFLNDFIGLGKSVTNRVRSEIQDFLMDDKHVIWKSQNQFLFPRNNVILHLPIQIGDYTDFYSSESHARNVGMMFRDPNNALLPNWKHLPVAYHGRASSIFVSGTNFKRPHGQIKGPDDELPRFAATQKLDFELEMAAVIGKKSDWQVPISTEEAMDHVFGYVLFNDWSARDIQQWETMPLGPFLGKNFFSSISPWVVTSEALEPFKIKSKSQDPTPLPYLQEKEGFQFDIDLNVHFQTKEGQSKLICRSNFSNLYWTVAQQIAHHTVNGCNLNVGDLLASGTISGDKEGSFGSLLEITWSGKNPILFEDGITRTFVEDGDTIIFEGFGKKADKRIGFGNLINTVLQ
ncbi:MAG TPA: fumarylacetoacetase [Saprospiraceae bacterium]|nr:fumarylacetoacetase [Saprospiraceae bacterium]